MHDPKLGLKDEHWIEVGGTDLKPDEPVVVEGGYNLPEGTEVAVEKAAEAKGEPELESNKPGESRCPESAHDRRRPAVPRAQRGLNLVVLARPYFGLIVLATLLLAVFGFISMLRMPSGIYPEVAFPRITVIAQTPGLAVTTVEVAVTRPIEEAVGTVLGVRQVRSKTVRGASQVDIDFTPGTEMVQALNDVRAKIADINAQFPAGTSTLIERQTPSVFPIISFVVTGGRDPSALHDYAYYDLRPRISRIDDVSYVTVQGGDIREIVVEVDPAAAGGHRPVDCRRGRSRGQRPSPPRRGPVGPRTAAIPGTLEQPGRRPDRPGAARAGARQRPDDPRGRRGPRRSSPTKIARRRSAPTARTPSP